MIESLPLDALERWLRAELDGAPAGSTAVLAGHFAIFSAGGAAVDLLDDPAAGANAGAEMLAFTRFTWTAACGALSAARARAARLLLMVDDIQYVHPVLDEPGARERLGAVLAADYLASTPSAPVFHARALEAHGIGAGAMLRHSDTRWLFSERELRRGSVRHLKQRLGARDGAAAGLSANADQSQINVAVPEHGDHCLVFAGHASCAGGYLELLSEVHRRGVQTFIALVPMRCRTPVTLGTTLAFHLLGLEGLTVITVAVPDVTAGLEASVWRVRA